MNTLFDLLNANYAAVPKFENIYIFNYTFIYIYKYLCVYNYISQDVCYRDNIVGDYTTIESTDALPSMEYLDAQLSVDELRKAIASLISGKAPGNNELPPDVIKAGRSTPLHHYLYELLLQCWEEETYLKTCVAPKSPRSARTKEAATTATTTDK